MNSKAKGSFCKVQYKFLRKSDFCIYFLGVLGSFGLGIALPIFALLFGDLVSNLYKILSVSDFLDKFLNLCFSFIYVGISTIVSSILMITCWTNIGKKISNRFKESYFELIMNRKQSWFDSINPHEFVFKFQNQVKSIESAFGEKLGNLIMSIIMFVSCFIVSYYTSWKLSLVLTSLVPFFFIFGYLIQKFSEESSNKNQRNFEKAGGIAEEVLYHIKNIKAFFNNEYEIRRYNKELKNSYINSLAFGAKTSIFFGIYFFIIFAGFALATWYGGELLLNKEKNSNTGLYLGVGEILVVLFSIIFGSLSVGQVAPIINLINVAVNNTNDFFLLDDLEKCEKVLGSRNNDNIKTPFFKGESNFSSKISIKFSNVSFKYENYTNNFAQSRQKKNKEIPENNDLIENEINKGTKVLSNINFELEENTKTFIIGKNGSGKSTIAYLLEKFYEEYEGKIEIFGKDLKEIPVDVLRNMIIYSPQESVIIDDTIHENIKFGMENVADDEILSVLEKVNGLDIIENNKENLNLITGSKGSNLSNGQKQRISLARALLRKPKILILDEVTSALDFEKEKEIFKVIDNLSRNITVLIIANRLSFVKDTDNIIVLKDSEIFKIGKHSELKEQNLEFYNNLFQIFVSGSNRSYDNLPQNNINQVVSKNLNSKNDDAYANDSSNDNYNKNNIQNNYISREERAAEGIKSVQLRIKHEESHQVHINTNFNLNKMQLDQNNSNNNYNYKNKSYAKTTYNIKFYLKNIKCIVFLAILFSIMNGAIWPAYGILVSEVYTSLTEFQPHLLLKYKNDISVYFLILAAISGLLIFLSNFFLSRIGEHIIFEIRRDLFKKYLTLDMQFFDVKEHSPSILLKMLISDTYKINGLAVSLVGNSIKTISTLVLGYSLSIGYDWRIGLIALAFLPFMVLAYIFQGKASLKLAHSSDKLENDSASIISSSICNSKTFISYKMQDKIKQIFKENIKKNEKFVFKYSLWNGVSYAITGLIMFVLFGVVLYSGSTFIFSFNKPVTIPNYLKSCFTIILGIFGISQGQLYAVDTVDAKKSMENIFNIFNIIPKNQEITIEGLDIYDKDIENKNSLNINNIPSLSKERYSENKHNLNILGKIEFRDVGFKYDEKKSDFCLENLNFTIEPGQKVAIVGSSGSGKSTIFSLLERFYLVNSGQILIDNKNIQEYDLSFLRKEVLGYMLENPAVFKRSIKENILYGNFSAEEKDIERLCDLLKIKYLLERENYSTNNKFSSGEQQRISLARVLVKKPKVILLDEPTATLDNESEIYVQNFLDNHFKNTTVICIAHRLKTIMNSDFIIFMDQGRIVEKGTHKELMELKGKYYELFNHGVSF